MFTGIIEEVGEITAIRSASYGLVLEVKATNVMQKLSIGDSIAINGVCLTITNITRTVFQTDVVQETLNRTTLTHLKPGARVNLERALMAGSRMGGHLVQGHIDCLGTIQSIISQFGQWQVTVQLPGEFAKYIISKGSIAINGISLTVAKCYGNNFEVAVIPYTWQNTNFTELNPGDPVNLELDIIGKYVERFVNPFLTREGITITQLKSYGY